MCLQGVKCSIVSDQLSSLQNVSPEQIEVQLLVACVRCIYAVAAWSPSSLAHLQTFWTLECPELEMHSLDAVLLRRAWSPRCIPWSLAMVL